MVSLFLTPEDLEQLRSAEDRRRPIIDRCIATAERLLDEPVVHPDMDRPWGPYLSPASDNLAHLRRCAFAYLMTGDERFHRRAKAAVDEMLGWDRWIDPYHERPDRRYGLMTGIVSTAMAHYLDWCGDAIDDEERALIANTWRKMAVEPLIHDTDLPAGMFFESFNNWISVMVGGAGLMSLLLMDREPFLEELLVRCDFHLRRYLDWINDDGSTDEGGSYWAFGMEHAVPLLEAFRRHGDRLPGALRWRKADALYRHRKLALTGYFPMYCMQGAEHVVNFGDCDVVPLHRAQPILYWLAARSGDGRLQWLADRLENDDPMSAVYCDPQLEAEPPDKLPSSRAFHGAGWAMLREDLDSTDGFLLAVRGGHNAKTHCHHDLGTFIIRAGGRNLIVDCGRPQYCKDYWIHGVFTYGRETIGHNCILIDGQGQQGGMAERAEITRCEDFGREKHMSIEVRAEEIALQLHRRQFDVTLGEPTRVEINDEVQLARKARVTWLLHYDPEGEAEIDGDRVIIRSGEASITMTVSAPIAVELRVETDHEVPFVAIETPEIGRDLSLRLECEIMA